MNDLTPNHPAVHILAIGMDDYLLEGEDEWSKRREDVNRCLAAALPHLTADDLRDTPAGRELMAEGWDALIESMSGSGEFHDVDLRTMQSLNPYRDSAQ